jgi:hypothetical protein
MPLERTLQAGGNAEFRDIVTQQPDAQQNEEQQKVTESYNRYAEPTE